MRVFVTGGTGYIGSVIVEKLRNAGHAVTALARSYDAARKLEEAGAEPVSGSLTDALVLNSAVRCADAVIHAALPVSGDVAETDRIAAEAILNGLAGSGRTLIFTSGIWVAGDTGGRTIDESAAPNPAPLVAWRPGHEQMVLEATGVRGVVIRPGMVYGRGGGAPGDFARDARQYGVVRYVGNGENHWPLVHVDDLADLYVRALTAGKSGLYFATAGPPISVKEIAAAAAAPVGAAIESIPLEQARLMMGAVADAFALDQHVTSQKAMTDLGWKPCRPSVLEVLRRADRAD